MTKYTHAKKKKLAEKISKITNKSEMKDVKKIIFNSNPELAFVKHSTGILMHFESLNEETYATVEEYLNKKILKDCAKRVKNINNMESAMSSDMILSSSDADNNTDSSNFKYSNKEKNIMRRKNYEQALNEINGNETLSVDFEKYDNQKDDNIFIKKS
jgi:hypothetical protein